jgi:signal peptidase I
MAEKKEEGGFAEVVKTVIYALLIAGVIRTLLFQPFWIPSGSMKDTLLIGDFLFVNKFAYGYSQHSCPFSMCPFIEGRIFASEPERGDIVVFKHPGSHIDYIKRLIGLPGDQIQMKDGVLYINGEEVPQVPDGTFEEIFEVQGSQGSTPQCANGVVARGAICEKEKFIETLPNGVEHSILNIRDISADNTLVFTVPPGQYFMMGDNRDNSVDSRFPVSRGGVGFVPFENFVGKANRVIFSSAGKSLFFFWTWRKDRFFKELK